MRPADNAEALARQAWAAFTRGDLAEACRCAEAASTPAEGPAGARASLGFFLLRAGKLAESDAVLADAAARWPDYAATHWYLGLLRKAQGDDASAVVSLREALALDDSLDDCAFTLAWLLHDRGELAEAARWAERIFAGGATAGRALQWGWLQQRQGRLRGAIGTYRQGLALAAPGAPEHARLCVHLAQCQAELGELDAARATVQAGLSAHPEDEQLLVEHGWQLRRAGDRATARATLRSLAQREVRDAQAWYLLGLLEHEGGDARAADRALARAHELQPGHPEAMLLRARLQREWSQGEGARWLVDQVLFFHPGHQGAQDQLAQFDLDAGRTLEARSWLVPRLRGDGRTVDRWRLLAAACVQRSRPRAALRALRRALRLDPANAEALRALGWIALQLGEREAAVDAVRRLLAGTPDPAAQVQAAFILAECGALAEAAGWAERAVSQWPQSADAWRALSSVRQRQGRTGEAESAVLQALQLAPDNVDALRQLGWVLLGARRPGEAQLALRRALASSRDPALAQLELGRALHAGGELAQAHAAIRDALARRPDWPPALLLRARLLSEGEPADQAQAVGICEALLRRGVLHSEALQVLLALAAGGVPAAWDACATVTPGRLSAGLRAAIEAAVHTRGSAHLLALAALARSAFEEDPWFEAAALYAASFDATRSGASLALQARDAYRALKLRTGLTRLPLGPRPDRAVRRPRIAYVAGQLHQPLLRRVLAAHDPGEVDVFLFTSRPAGDLPSHVRVLALDPPTLETSFAAIGIDVAIDAGGLHPMEGQDQLLAAYARRIAPCQVGWLGCWGTGGGLFDVLLADAVSVPADQEPLYEERVVRLAGGQWCWDPPAGAPEVGPLPATLRGEVSFGVVARPLRLNDASITAFARTVAAVPGARIRFIGPVADDRVLCRSILAAMEDAGVAAHRVVFEPRRTPAAYLAWCAEVDIVLDTFPGSGGLSLLHPLWMGVPVVTLAGDRAGARQGASLLHAIGWTEGVAEDVESFIACAARLAGDLPRLAATRAGLRARMAASPLLDGRRLAAQVEALALAEPIAPPGPLARKAAVRQAADRALQHWLAAPREIVFPPACEGAAPDVSVVVVLYNQAGLTRKTLQALADQRDASFETIIVDNASSDATGELLDRLRGARIVRNADNAGFLLAANQGAALARGRHVLLLNSDAIVQAGALRAARDALDRDPTIGALGGRIVLTDGGLQEAGNVVFRDGSAGGIGRGEDPFAHAARAARATDYVSGVFLATPRAWWERLGGFDTSFAPAYYEDTDYCRRVWEAGGRVVYEPSVLVEHLEWGSAVEEGAPPALLRNQARFRERHAGWLRTQPAPHVLALDGDRWRSPEDTPRRRPRVLVLDNEVPHVDRGGGLPRARLLLQALADLPLTLFPLWSLEDDWKAIARSLPPTVEVALGHGLRGLEAFLARRRGVYDVLVVSRPPNLEAIAPLRARRPDLFKGMRLVYDAEALFALREIGQAAVRGTPWTRNRARAHLEKELALADGASEVLVVSARDARFFQAAGHRTRVVSHATTMRRDAPGPAARRGLLFVGALVPDTPNEDGLLWFVREVLPLLEPVDGQAPVLTVVGRCRSERIAALAGPRVRLVGAQADLVPCYDAARVFVAPARFAGGVPAKVIEAAAAGIPVVASSLLVRQLGWSEGAAIRGARDAAEFARAIDALLRDDAAWLRQRAGAWDECARRYDPARFRAELQAAVDPLGAGARAIAQAK